MANLYSSNKQKGSFTLVYQSDVNVNMYAPVSWVTNLSYAEEPSGENQESVYTFSFDIAANSSTTYRAVNFVVTFDDAYSYSTVITQSGRTDTVTKTLGDEITYTPSTPIIDFEIRIGNDTIFSGYSTSLDGKSNAPDIRLNSIFEQYLNSDVEEFRFTDYVTFLRNYWKNFTFYDYTSNKVTTYYIETSKIKGQIIMVGKTLYGNTPLAIGGNYSGYIYIDDQLAEEIDYSTDEEILKIFSGLDGSILKFTDYDDQTIIELKMSCETRPYILFEDLGGYYSVLPLAGYQTLTSSIGYDRMVYNSVTKQLESSLDRVLRVRTDRLSKDESQVVIEQLLTSPNVYFVDRAAGSKPVKVNPITSQIERPNKSANLEFDIQYAATVIRK